MKSVGFLPWSPQEDNNKEKGKEFTWKIKFSGYSSLD